MSKKRLIAEALFEYFGEKCLEEAFWKRLKKRLSKKDRENEARVHMKRVADEHGKAAMFYADRAHELKDKPWIKGKRKDDLENELALRYNAHIVRSTQELKGDKAFQRLRSKAMRGSK